MQKEGWGKEDWKHLPPNRFLNAGTRDGVERRKVGQDDENPLCITHCFIGFPNLVFRWLYMIDIADWSFCHPKNVSRTFFTNVIISKFLTSWALFHILKFFLYFYSLSTSQDRGTRISYNVIKRKKWCACVFQILWGHTLIHWKLFLLASNLQVIC